MEKYAQTPDDFPTPEKPYGTVIGTWNWHVWRKDFHGDEWIGSFSDPKTALNWCKTQYGKIFTVNNVPPSTSRLFNGRPTGAQTTEQRSARKAEVQRPLPVAKRPVNVPVAVEPVKEDKNAARLRKSAKVRLDKHKADEAADVASGKIKNV